MSLKELAQRFNQLPESGKKQVHRHVCWMTLLAWQRFANQIQEINYVDSVVGMAHKMDLGLPFDAFDVIFNPLAPAIRRERIAALKERYLEPLSALQDGDLELPNQIEPGYYAIYNAFAKYALGRTIDDWLIVNQALSVSSDESDWTKILSAALIYASDSME